MLLNKNFYVLIVLILTYATLSECNESLFSSVQKEVDELFGGKKEEPVPNANIIEDYVRAIKEREDEIQKLNSILENIDVKLRKIKPRAKNCFLQTSSCLRFGNSSGIHQIYAPGLDEPFDVLCNSKLAGPGWLVIQQRIQGRENFRRNFSDYRQGFGSLDSDFFLGLEKIHRLTSAYRHELFIYFEAKDYNVKERYDWFKVGSEFDQYRLDSLGKNLFDEDMLRPQEKMRFYTIDRDNKLRCAQLYTGGWWFGSCGVSNLNGPYRWNGVDVGAYLYIKNIRMLIRPKID